MKKQILIIAYLLFLFVCQAQNNPNLDKPNQMSKEELTQFYLQKGQEQKKIGKILSRVGAGICVVGIVVGSIEASGESDGTMSLAFFSLGAASMVTSLPFFIAGSKNKYRASLLIKENNIPISIDRNKNIPLKSIGIGFIIGN